MRKSVWGVIASSQLKLLPSVATQFNDIVATDPVAGWGFAQRNTLYTGPAAQIEDVDNPGTYTDMEFDSDGLVTDSLPYTNNRVTKLYDQWGDDDQEWVDINSGAEYFIPYEAGTDTGGVTAATMYMKHNNAVEYVEGGLKSSKTSSTANWAVDYPKLISTCVRTTNQVRASILGVKTSTGIVDFNWGMIIAHTWDWGIVVKDTYINITGTDSDYNNGRLYASILDHSSTAVELYVNDGFASRSASAVSTYSYSADESFRIGMFSVNFGQFSGAVFEAHVFDSSTEWTGTEVTDITALQEQCENGV